MQGMEESVWGGMGCDFDGRTSGLEIVTLKRVGTLKGIECNSMHWACTEFMHKAVK